MNRDRVSPPPGACLTALTTQARKTVQLTQLITVVVVLITSHLYNAGRSVCLSVCGSCASSGAEMHKITTIFVRVNSPPEIGREKLRDDEPSCSGLNARNYGLPALKAIRQHASEHATLKSARSVSQSVRRFISLFICW